MRNDFRYALRSIRSAPGLAGVIVLTLALGIGANTAIFSVVNTLLIDPLPYGDADRLVGITFDNESGHGMQRWPYPKFTALASLESPVFEGVASYGDTSLTILVDGHPERVATEVVSASYFPLLGLQPAIGRAFRPDEDRNPGEHALVILSDTLWRRTFAADAAVIGRTVGIRDRQYQVIGVMPPSFRGQTGTTEMWIPGMMADHAMYRGAATGAFSWWARVLAKLRPGVTLEQAQAAMPAVTRRVDTIAPAMSRTAARRDGTQLFKLVPLKQLKVDPQVSRTFLLFLLAVGFVLLIACANTANLLLGRAIARQKEFGIRRALGASRGAILRQVTIESLLLALAGGASGLLVALWGLDWLTTQKPWTASGFWTEYARTFEYFRFALEPRVLVFALGLSLGVGVLFGLAPAWHASRADLTDALKRGAGASEAGFGARSGIRTRSALVLTEIAFSLVLLVSAGLMTRSFSRVSRADLGFEPANLVSMTVGAGSTRPAAYYRELIARVASIPGAESVAMSVGRPLVDVGWSGPVWPGETRTPESPEIESVVNAVTPGFFETYRMRLLEGRTFTELDRENAPRVAVVSKALADAAWPGRRAIGQKILSDLASRREPLEVVGVVDHAVYTTLEDPPPLVLYVSTWQTGMRLLTPNGVSVRLAPGVAASADFMRAVRAKIQSLDGTVAVYNALTTGERAARITSRYRYGMFLVGAIAALALFLAAMGIYGVMAYGVASRRREIGIRMALGATPADVLTLIVGGGLKMTAVGIVAGLAAAYLSTRALTSLLYGVDPGDPATFAAIALIMTAVAGLASYVPARRAIRVNPVETLRGD